MLLRAAISGAAIAALAMSSAQAQQAPTETDPSALAEGVAAVVNDEVVSTVDVRNRAIFLLASSGQPLTQENLQRAIPRALRSLVDEHLQLQEAREFEITVEKSEVDRALFSIAERNGGTLDDLSRELAQIGVSITTLRDQLEADIAWRRLVSGRFGSRVRISEGQVHDTMERVMSNAAKEQMLVSELLIPAESEAEFAEAQELALQVLGEIRRAPGEQVMQVFGAAAQQISAASSAATGGDLGWVAAGELRSELERALDGAQPGQLVGPIVAGDGVYLLALRDRRPGVDLKAATRLTLQEVMAPGGERGALERARRRIKGCDSLERAVNNVSRAEIVPLGDVMQAELNEETAKLVDGLEEGETSEVFTMQDSRVAMLVVCEKGAEGEGLPTPDDVEDRLFEQELAMLSQRYLRNLRRESTIITP